jgi:hypothetical protein
MRNKWLWLVILLIGSLVLQPAFAGKKKGKNGDGGDDQAVTKVTAVDTTNSKITLTIVDNKQDLVYNVPLGTAVTIDGAPSDLSQVKPGMFVVSYTESDSGSLSQIDVSASAPAKN